MEHVKRVALYHKHLDLATSFIASTEWNEKVLFLFEPVCEINISLTSGTTAGMFCVGTFETIADVTWICAMKSHSLKDTECCDCWDQSPLRAVQLFLEPTVAFGR